MLKLPACAPLAVVAVKKPVSSKAALWSRNLVVFRSASAAVLSAPSFVSRSVKRVFCRVSSVFLVFSAVIGLASSARSWVIRLLVSSPEARPPKVMPEMELEVMLLASMGASDVPIV
jgi:hypothetical protein